MARRLPSKANTSKPSAAFACSRRPSQKRAQSMFDIGLSELMVIGVVALVVIGPERRLPKVARTLGLLFGRLQRYVTQVKSQEHQPRDGAGRARQGEDRVRIGGVQFQS